MNKKLKVAIIIPCYNEQDSLLKLYVEINKLEISEKYSIHPIFVNDCSKDNTLQVLVSNNLEYIDLPVNLGIGGAVQTGFKYALKNKFDIAIQMDGDGQHPPGELSKIIQPLLNNECDVVIGSRYLSKEGFQSSWLRRVGINYFKWLNKQLVGVIINDSTSGYRALNTKALEIVSDYYPDEYPEPEAIILFKLNNLTIKEVAVTMRERQGGESSIKAYKTVYYMIKVTLSTLFLFISIKLNKKLS
jgi:glycosyltransferase involved in cell wall biosynthesis